MAHEKKEPEFGQDAVKVPVVSVKAIEDMTLDEVDALSNEEIMIALQRAELREKLMALQKTKALSKKAKEDQAANIARSKADAARQEAIRKACSHMKGGNRGNIGGNDPTDYALVKHFLPSGALMILCLRCGQEEYSDNPLTGQPATPGFAAFNRLPTKNHTSGSSLFVLRRVSQN
jgi:hypothetical protein